MQQIQQFVRRLGGRCVSSEYVNNVTALEFECHDGHRWFSRPTSVLLRGAWCAECRRRPYAAVVELAREHGGQCLSDTYVIEGMRWRCASGHEWTSPPDRIRRGGWCPRCAGRVTLGDLQTLAALHGGRCLARDLSEGANDALMPFECARGHRFDVRRRCVLRGQWCPVCSKADGAWQRTLALADAHATERGGRCLTRTRPEGRDPCFEWECAKGHRFAVRRRCVAVGQWCPDCAREDSAWEQAVARAAELGGVCLARSATAHESVRWRCAAGHVWTNSARKVADGSWCPRCSGRRLGIEHMQEMAAEHNGRCLSRKFVDLTTELRWECEKGHRWSAEPMSIRHHGTWCPQCALELRGPPIVVDAWNTALEQARELGGMCLDSDNTKGHRTRWRCAAGHEWNAVPYRVARGRWCAQCSGRRLNIEHMRALAAERGGRCVSEEYIDCQTHLLWECEKFHRWWARPTIVRTMGTWCPQCAWDRNAERMRSEARDRR